MPISKEKMARYPGGSIHSDEWKAIREQIRNRAGDRCEWCDVKNREMIQRSECRSAYRYHGEGNAAFSSKDGSPTNPARSWRIAIEVVCTVAHLDHDPTNNTLDNLRFLCQRCHLIYDTEHHAKNAAKTRRRQKGTSDLFEVMK